MHLRVANFERATSFYLDVLGFDITVYGSDVGLLPFYGVLRSWIEARRRISAVVVLLLRPREALD